MIREHVLVVGNVMTPGHTLPHFVFSTSLTDSSDISWNFNKFILNSDGDVVGRYDSLTKPTAIESDIVALLEKNKMRNSL